MTERLSRRDLMKLAAAGVLAGPAARWFDLLAGAAAPGGRGRAKSCILLWMAGGPSQTDTFDMKPDAPAEYRGEFKPIATSVPGLRVCEHLPKLARQMEHLAILRGMNTREGDHVRGTYLMRTGYPPTAGTIHPGIDAVISAELGRPDFELPNAVWLGTARVGSGFLGARHTALSIQGEPGRPLENVAPRENFPTFDNRMNVLDRLEKAFAEQYHAGSIHAHRATYQQAARLMHSDKTRAFELAREPAKVRAWYGSTRFGDACLVARRLVEVGVPFVGVDLPDWDTHEDNWGRMRPLLAQVDGGMSALLADLKQRGLLDTTLVIWMGEFGRSSRINSGGKPGREHQADGWSAVLAGGGLKTGQAVGATSKTGDSVTDRPVRTADFMATLCQALGIDCTKENKPDGRPIRLVGKGGKPVEELFA